mmetsp:Transcript_22595/g.60038  ORF Transcript_22595/g.60038 Transcript_22595/m.60038 type:complete len:224 (+) Transcript_22595:1168-1839(+)
MSLGASRHIRFHHPQRDFLGLLRRDFWDFNVAALMNNAINEHLKSASIAAQISEVVLVEDTYPAGLEINRSHPDRLEQILVFVHRRMNRPIWKYQPVDAKIDIVDFVPKFTAVPPILNTLVISQEKTLVHPIPHKTTLQAMMRSNGIPIFLQVTTRVAHGVSVFTHDQRSVPSRISREVDNFLNARVHRTDKISCAAPLKPVLRRDVDDPTHGRQRTLVLNWP